MGTPCAASSLAALGAAGLLLAACSTHAPTTAAAASDAGLEAAVVLQEAFAGVAEKVFPSVVCLTSFVNDASWLPPEPEVGAQGWREASQADRRYPNKRRLASASGFALADDGYVLTCLQFLRKPDGGLADLVDAETPNGGISLCRIVGTEPTLDLAVLRLEVYPEGRRPVLTPIAVAAADSIRVGQWAIAVGDPLGPGHTFTAGLVSSRPQRDCYQAALTATLLQASLHVSEEASGGPLVNIRGEAIGIITPRDADRLGVTDHGVVYALPMAIASGIFESLKVANSFTSPWLGFSVLNMAEYRVRQKAGNARQDPKQPLMGVYIDDVFDPSPASRAGVRVGDILTKVNGQRFISVFHFQRTLYLAGVGKTVTLDLYRGGESLVVDLTVEGRPAAADAG